MLSTGAKLRLAPTKERVLEIRDAEEIDVFAAGTMAWKEKMLERLESASSYEELKDLLHDLILRSR